MVSDTIVYLMDKETVGKVLLMDFISVGDVRAKGSVHAFGKLSENARNFVSFAFSTCARRTG